MRFGKDNLFTFYRQFIGNVDLFRLDMSSSQPPGQGGETLRNLVVAHRHADGFPVARQHAQFARAGDGGLEQVALQHGVVLGHDRVSFKNLILIEIEAEKMAKAPLLSQERFTKTTKYGSSAEKDHANWVGRRAKTPKDGYVKGSCELGEIRYWKEQCAVGHESNRE